MRQKAERAIRRAVEELTEDPPFRIDQVRRKTGLIPKVFDKTILDMERMGTIELFEMEVESISTTDTGGLVRRGEIIYERFRFIDTVDEMPAPIIPSATVSITLDGMDAELWHQFEQLCHDNEQKPAMEVILEFIAKTVQDGKQE